MKNFDNFRYHKNAIPQDKTEKEDFFKKLESDFFEEVSNSEASSKFLEKFWCSGGSTFLKSYAQKKVELIKDYEYYQSLFYQNEKDELDYQKRAELCLDAILQKKLFNLQLQWRAGKIVLPDVESCFDFDYWGKYIRSCSFIPEITRNEIQLMKEFLLKIDDPDDFCPENMYDWQNYDYLLEKNENDSWKNIPEWYSFYDNRMGSSMLLLLPDIRGTKEDLYRKLVNREHQKENPRQEIPKPLTDQRPFIKIFGHDMIDYARVVESDPYILELFRYYEFEIKERDEKPDYWDLETALRTLLSADRPIHFDPMKNWDEAIFSAEFNYQNIKTVEALDFVYNKYQMYRDLGLSQVDLDHSFNQKPMYDKIRQEVRENIQKGKWLNGEID